MAEVGSTLSMKILDSGVELTAGVELRDRDWSLNFGQVVRTLRTPAYRSLTVDLSAVGWGDPLPLLALACAIREFEASRDAPAVMIDLGAPRQGVSNRFLRFIATQGFLGQFSATGIFRWNQGEFAASETSDIDRLRDQLAALTVQAAYDKSDCIPARLFDTRKCDDGTAGEFVENLIDEAHRTGIGPWLARSSRQRAFLMHKLRVILTELTDNIVEHAYGTGTRGFGAVYARIRGGAPDDAAVYTQWQQHRNREVGSCPCLGRANYGKKPGWLELFICDIGCGLMHHLPVRDSKSPLGTEVHKIFRDPISRHADRVASRKTSITGLQHIGYVMEAGPEEPIRNDFVRIYSNGEWIGEHFPWPPDALTAWHENSRQVPDHATGTYFTFCLEPPVSGRLPASEIYPNFFFIPGPNELSSIRARLADPSSLYCPPHGFSDRLPSNDTPQRGRATAAWIAELDMVVGVVRPARTIRKVDLIDFLDQLAARVRSGVSPLQTLILADVPTFLAIDLAYLLKDSKKVAVWPNSQLSIVIVTQDWCVALFRVARSLDSLIMDADGAKEFTTGATPGFSASDVAAILRAADSRLFWQNVGEAYVSEVIKWDAKEIMGYLDLPQALVHPDSFHAAQRALRRALRSFRVESVLTADGLVGSLLTDDFEILDGNLALEHDKGRSVIVTGSIKVTGTTTSQFDNRRDVVVDAIVHLLSRDDPISGSTKRDGIDQVIALEWLPSSQEPADVFARMYERIPGTAFVIRGGEGAIPLPRFAQPPSGTTYTLSYYGENPNEAYDSWQKRGLLKFGHWVYGGRHDLLTVNLLEAVNSDSSGKILSWLIGALSGIKRSITHEQTFVLLYPSHVVTDRIIRQLQNRTDNPIDGANVYALKIVRNQSTSPYLVSPVERDRLGAKFRRFRSGTVVALFDDGTVTGKSLTELQQFVEALWLQVHINSGPTIPPLDLRTIVLLDRTGLPTSRRLVEAEVERNPRLWRWDVPGLGNQRSCTLCAALSRCRHLRDRINDRDLAARLDLWEDHWRPLSIVGEWSDGGLLPDVLPGDDRSRFGTEVTLDGRRVTHYVRHRISTSRASLAAEIFRSTSRRGYALERARAGLTGSGLPLSPQTRIEILCSSILLYFDDLNYGERLQRFTALLDLLWQEPTATAATEIAGLTLLLPEGALAEDLAYHTRTLVEAHEIPNDDAFLIATSLMLQTGTGLFPREGRNNIGWSLIRMITSSRSGLRGVLARIFQVTGWDHNSFHSGWLVHFFASQRGVRKPQDVQLVAIMLEQLAAAFDELPVECVASWNDSDIAPVDDATQLRAYVQQLRDLAEFGERLPLSSRYAQVCSDKPRELDSVLQGVSAFLFQETPGQGLRQRYRKYLTLRLAPDTPKSWAIERVLVQVRESLPQCMGWHKPNTIDLMAEGRPVFRCLPAFWSDNCPIIYFDALVRQCIAELASNVMHSSNPIPCPWSTEISGTADMWYRLELEKTETGDDQLMIEFCNAVADPLTTNHRKGTNTSRHLANLGGRVSIPSYEGGVVSVRLTIPAISALAWE